MMKMDSQNIFTTISGNLQFKIFQFAIFSSIILLPSTVFAHGMDVFASVEGKIINGKANYHDGTPVRDCDVIAYDTSNKELGRTKTDGEGKFALEAGFRCDYRLLVDAGDGHGGEYLIPAKALPSDLPPRGVSDVSADTAHSHIESDSQHLHEPQAETVTTDTKLDEKKLLSAIHADIDLLEEQLNEYEHRIRFRDILGGIGFIVGIVGAAYGCYYRGLMKKTGNCGNNGKRL
jgi:nickel transport protein